MSPQPFVDPRNQPTLFGEGSRPRQRAERAADPLFDALCYVTKTHPASLTASGRGMINRHLKELRAVGATPEEVVRRSRVYVEKWRQTPTSGALTRQWASLEESPIAARTIAPRPVEALVSRERLSELAERGRSWMDGHR